MFDEGDGPRAYVGQTTKPRTRWLQHRRSGGPTRLRQALKRCDADFEHGVQWVPLEVCGYKGRYMREEVWSAVAEAQWPEGYNQKEGLGAMVGHARFQAFMRRRTERSLPAALQRTERLRENMVVELH